MASKPSFEEWMLDERSNTSAEQRFRSGVLQNLEKRKTQHSSLELLVLLSFDEDLNTRVEIAKNLKADRRLLELLAKDPHPYVALLASESLTVLNH